MAKYTDEQIQQLESLASLGRLAQKLASNKDHVRDFQRLVKKVEPERYFPDLEREDVLAEVDKRLETEKQERERALTLARLESQKRGLLDGTLIPGRVFEEAQVKEIEEKIMPKYGLADYEAAAKLYAADLPAPVPGYENAMQGDRWTLPEYPGLHEDPAKAATTMAKKIIDEFQQPRRR